MYFSKAGLGFCLLLSSSFQESKGEVCDEGQVPRNANGTSMNHSSWLYNNSYDIPALHLCHEHENLTATVQLPPDYITMTEDGRREIKYTLKYRVAKYIGPAFTTFLKLFNGIGPAPTIRIRPGDNVIIDLVNELEYPIGNTVLNEYRTPNTTNLHLHGAHIIGINPGDNVSKIVLPGSTTTYNYTFDYNHMPGTMWYHTHWHGATAHQTGQGAAGLLIIEDPEDYQIPNYLKKMTEIEMVLTHLHLVNDTNKYKDDMTDAAERSGSLLTKWKINGTNLDLTYFTTKDLNMILVNMQYKPKVTIMEAGKWYRWRILLASVEERLAMALKGGKGQKCEVKLLAKDGIYLTNAPRLVSDIILSAGNRADVAVRCREAGKVNVINMGKKYGGTGGLFNMQPQIMSLNIVKRKGKMDRDLTEFAVPRPCYLVDLKSANKKTGELNPETLNIQFTFNGTSNSTSGGVRYHLKKLPSINGYSWVDQQTRLPKTPLPNTSLIKVGTVQEVVMKSALGHPYHQHINPFQIMAMDDYQNANEAFRNWYQLGDWQDVLQTVNNVQNATVRFAADKFPGPMVVHCHILFHEDRGMINTYKLIPGDKHIKTWPGAKRVDPSCIPDDFRPSSTSSPTGYPTGSPTVESTDDCTFPLVNSLYCPLHDVSDLVDATRAEAKEFGDKVDNALSVDDLTNGREYLFNEAGNNYNLFKTYPSYTATDSEIYKCYKDFYGDIKPIDQVLMALKREKMEFAGPALSQDYSDATKGTIKSNYYIAEETAKKVNQYTGALIEMYQLMESAVQEVAKGCISYVRKIEEIGKESCDVAIKIWDNAVAVQDGPWYLGSKRCENYQTCGWIHGKGEIALANIKVLNLFQVGQNAIRTGDIVGARGIIKLIQSAQIVSYIQGVGRYASQISESAEKNINYNPKEYAEGAAFATGMLPQLYKCNRRGASVVDKAFQIRAGNSWTTSLADILAAIRSEYQCLGITCEDVGGLWDGLKYYADAQPCVTNYGDFFTV